MQEQFVASKCSSILISFVTDPFLYTVSHAWAKKHSRFHGLQLDIFIPCTFQEAAEFKSSALIADYENRWHNSYYFRSQATAIILTNIQNHHFILRNVDDFLDIFCKLFMYFD